MLDKLLVRLCTKIAHNLQRATGLTSYFLARTGIFISVMAILADVINYFRKYTSFTTTPLSLIIDSVCLLIMIGRSNEVQHIEDSVGSDTKPAELTHYVSSSHWRLFWLLGLLWSLMFTPGHSGNLFLELLRFPGYSLGCFIFWCFIVVDPLPPGTSKVREWLNSFASHPVPAPAKS